MDEEHPADKHILTYLDGHLVYNTLTIPWDMRFFPVTANEFQAVRSGGADGILRFSTSAEGNTHLEMLQDGNVIGRGVRKKPVQ